jgi:hypothetical protein
LFLGLGLLGIWQFHNTEFYSNFDLVPGGRGDNRLVTALLEYLYRSFHGVGQMISPAFYYPTPRTLGYADVFLTHALFYSWLRGAGMDLFSSYQVCVLAFDILNYVFCFCLIHCGFRMGVTASAIGSFFFAFNAPKFNQLSHPQLQLLFYLPLVLWALATWARESSSTGSLKAFALLSAAGIFLNLQLLSSFYLAWFFLFWFSLFLISAFILKATRLFLKDLFRRFWLSILGAGLVFGITIIPFLYLYLPVVRDLGGKDYSEVQMMIPNFWCFLWMGPRHSWWGWLGDACPALRNLPIEGEERAGYGVILLFIMILLTFGTLWILRKKVHKKTPPIGFLMKASKRNGIYLHFTALLVLTTAVFCLLGLQYGTGFSPWRLVYEVVPGAKSIRAVSRYAVFLALPVSIIVSFLCHALFEKAKAIQEWGGKTLCYALTLLVAGLAVLEQVSLPPYPAFLKKVELNRLEYLSQKLPAPCQAFYVTVNPSLPYTATDIQIDAMLLSAVRGIPTLNGYSGQSPKDNWGLFKVRSPQYGQYVQDWIGRHQLRMPVCGLEIDK